MGREKSGRDGQRGGRGRVCKETYNREPEGTLKVAQGGRKGNTVEG